MEGNNLKIQLIYKSNYGRDRFYPHCILSKTFLHAFKRSSFSIRQLKIFKEAGFEIEFFEEEKEAIEI